jgi:MFS transporter, DHA2 family, multidrug resistance protein
MGILAVATAPIVGRLLSKIDPRLIVTYGMGVLAVSFFMRFQLTTQADFGSVAWAMFVLGAGVPACLITLTALGVSDLPPDQVAAGSGLQNFLRVLSMAIGTSLTQTYWENATKASRADLVSIIDPTTRFQPPPNLPASAALPLFSRAVDSQASMLATNSFYEWATVLILIFAALIWLVKKPKGPLQQGAH